MSYQFLILEEALLDIEDAIEFYDTFQAQQKFVRKLRDGLKYVAENPLHLAVKYNNVRIYNLRSYKHQIHYRIVKEQIQVIAVFYGTSSPKTWVERATSI